MTWENPTYEEALRIVNADFKMRFSKTLGDMHITESRGYWEDNNPCDGKRCGHPPSSIHHSYYFARVGRDAKGRFLKPHRHWEAIKRGI